MTAVMHICGCSMEMENAKKEGTIGKCQSCLYRDYRPNREWCNKRKEVLKTYKENCKEWIVDHR